MKQSLEPVIRQDSLLASTSRRRCLILLTISACCQHALAESHHSSSQTCNLALIKLRGHPNNRNRRVLSTAVSTRGGHGITGTNGIAALESNDGSALNSDASFTVASAPGVGETDESTLARIKLVKLVLSQRLEYVGAGKRAKDIAHWMKQNRDYSNIDPMPERGDVSHNHTDTIVSGMTALTSAPELDSKLLKRLQRDPFPPNRLDLDIHDVAPSRPCYTDTMILDSGPTYIQLGLRMIQLSFHFAPIWSTVGLALVHKKFRQDCWYRWLATSIGSCGPAWIKWGQWSSTRNDMFPEALCDHLGKLQAAAPAHSWLFSKSSVEQSLGLSKDTLEHVFDQFDERPLASGSIAQVHKAVLCGVPVAIKIRHPRVVQLMEVDFRLMTGAAGLMDKIPFLSWLHIRETVTQFSHSISAQAYLQVEAHHLEVLNYNFRHWSKVGFPIPFYASQSVIIETFEPGRIASDIINEYENIAISANSNTASAESGVTVIEGEDDIVETADDQNLGKEVTIDGHDIMPLDLARFMVSNGVGLYLKMLLVDNLVHSDLHPGNIMVDAEVHPKRHMNGPHDERALQQQQNPSTWNRAQSDALSAMNNEMENIHITIVDAGMVAKLTDAESAAFIGLLACLGEGDGNEAAEYTLQFSLGNILTDAQRRYFSADMVGLFAETCRGYGTGVDVGEVLRGVLGLIRKHRVRVDGNFATLVINCLCIESMARRVCPSYNVLDAGRPLFQCYRRFVKKGKVLTKSPIFGMSMSISALKKELSDEFFFRDEAKRQKRKQHLIIDNIQFATRAKSHLSS